MHGLRIRKTLRQGNTTVWPEGCMLDGILRPIGPAVEPLWWLTDETRYAFPTNWILECVPTGDAVLNGPSFDRFDAAFVPGQKVARPGFLPAFAHVVSGDWSLLYGTPTDPTPDQPLRDALARPNFFAPPDTFPPQVSLVIRGIDWAYWEIFARDPALIAAVHAHLHPVTGLSLEQLT